MEKTIDKIKMTKGSNVKTVDLESVKKMLEENGWKVQEAKKPKAKKEDK